MSGGSCIDVGRDCFGCNQEGENRNMCRKSNVLYNWECNVKDVCPDTGYDGQSSKNNFTRSSQHTSLYESWVRYENKVINPKTKRPYSKPQSHSFLFDHQHEDHNGDPPNFTLQSKRYYGKDRLACQVAEGVSLKMRKGKILNSKADWDAPSLIVLERNIHRGLWLIWPAAIINFFIIISSKFPHFPFFIICSAKSKSKHYQFCLIRPSVRNMSHLSQ